MRSLGVLVAVGLFAAGTGTSAAAQEATPQQQNLEFTVTVTGHAGAVKGSPSDHFLSFSGPVEIPGVGLKPGTYIFKPIGSSLVRVMSEDRSTVYATFFTTPVVRSSADDQAAEVTFERVDPKAPVRIESWFMPGQMTGMAPLYPSSLASSFTLGD